jgi:hypothetical protein
MLNQSRNDTAVLEYLQQYFNTHTTEDYPKSVEKLLAKFKPDQMELHTIKSKLWKKLDTILEDMKGVIK